MLVITQTGLKGNGFVSHRKADRSWICSHKLDDAIKFEDISMLLTFVSDSRRFTEKYTILKVKKAGWQIEGLLFP